MKEMEESRKGEVTAEEWANCEKWMQLTIKAGNKYNELFRKVDEVLKEEKAKNEKQEEEESGKTEKETKESAPDAEMEDKEETQLALLKLATTSPKELKTQELAEAHNKILEFFQENKPQFEQAWETLLNGMKEEERTDDKMKLMTANMTIALEQSIGKGNQEAALLFGTQLEMLELMKKYIPRKRL